MSLKFMTQRLAACLLCGLLVTAGWWMPAGLQADRLPEKQTAAGFVRVRGTHFYRAGQSEPYYFVGTNLWYGPILGSLGTGGDRHRLCAELDSLQALGVDNLRILVGADAGSCMTRTVTPCLQPAPGQLNDSLLVGLDFMLAEMKRRDMLAVIYLTNSWDWSGGYGFYLQATGYGPSPDAHGEGYNDYVAYAAQFFRDEAARNFFAGFVRSVVSRTNSLTGVAYADDPTIMAWQLCNEPRPFAADNAEAFVTWVRQTAALIKQLDPHHLVSTGSEGVVGCLMDEVLCRRIHACADIDYITVHLWPTMWGWASRGALLESLPRVYEKCGHYLEQHDRLARQLDKPYVVEEFGYPRDGNFLTPGSSTQARDAFYSFVFTQCRQSRDNEGALAGCNFWGWGGMGRPSAEVWEPGADYLCDPPHEPQGWYSVFNTDFSTLKLIRMAAGKRP